MKPGLRLIAAISLTACALAVAGQGIAETPGETPAAGYVLPETEVWDMASKDGQTYRIFVSRPEGEAPEGGFPVLYVLDGNAMFAGFAEARRIQSYDDDGLEKMILVAIGYPTDMAYDGRRMVDFLGPVQTPQLKEQFKDYPSGGRDRFLSFLMDELRPEIARRHTVDPTRQSLYGHSLGGLFALHVLYSRPNAFHAIMAASPSIWWDDQAILEEERAFAVKLREEKGPPPAKLLILAGEHDPGALPQDAAALAERLKPLSAYGLRSEFHLLDGENHVAVPSRSTTMSLRKAMEQP